jgi:hypothetical protein
MRALLGLGVAAALVAGCGSDDEAATEDISAAVKETAAAGSSRIELSGEDGGRSFTITGAADYEEDEARYTWSDRDGAGELRLVDDTLFTRSDALVQMYEEHLAGRTWISVRVPTEDRISSFWELFHPFPFIDPSRMLQRFEQAAAETSPLAERVVRGVPTQGYRITVDVARLIESAPEDDREAFRYDLARLPEKTTPVEVWLDDVGRARRIAVSWEGSSTTLDFYDYGIAFDVEAPPADQVIPKHELEAAQTPTPTQTEETP